MITSPSYTQVSVAVLIDNYVSSSGAMEEEKRVLRADRARRSLQVCVHVCACVRVCVRAHTYAMGGTRRAPREKEGAGGREERRGFRSFSLVFCTGRLCRPRAVSLQVAVAPDGSSAHARANQMVLPQE